MKTGSKVLITVGIAVAMGVMIIDKLRDHLFSEGIPTKQMTEWFHNKIWYNKNFWRVYRILVRIFFFLGWILLFIITLSRQ